MKFLISIWPHVIFLFLNSVIVVANTVFPWYLNKEDIKIVGIDALVDEVEYEVPNNAARLIFREINNETESYRSIVNSGCIQGLQERLVTLRCRGPIEVILSEAIDSATRNLAKKRDAIEQGDPSSVAFAEAFKEEFEQASIRFTLIEALGRLTLAEGILKDQYVDGWKLSVQGLLKSLIEEELRLIDDAKRALAELLALPEEPVPSGHLVLRVSIMNVGRESGFVFSSGDFEYANETLKFTTVRSQDLGNPWSIADATMNPFDQGRAGFLFFTLDPSNSERSKASFRRLITSRVPVDYRFSINTTQGQIEFNSSINSEPMSLELYR
ncbi:hypothetical protein [Thetidibacter halocola]|uniref:Uncharacterized protein n=1 Tax=Thetidibacter halocola TaxID=2827239 RepID=A0A8J7WHI5_9RHOB|nr:hypothetical protein [Thetidibacter halocola]MBS0125426.1 hypothetical protein [Thetidibacter halocola]